MPIFLLVVAIVLVFPFSSKALNMESQQYQLQSDDVVTESTAQAVAPSFEVPLSADQQAVFNSKGYVATSDSSQPFSVTLQSTNLNFQQLAPGKTSFISNTLRVSSPHGHQIFISETKPLTSLNGTVLPATSCDSGCSYLHAENWLSSKAGFGYTLESKTLPEDFLNSNYYRAVADLSKNQRPASISLTNLSEINSELKIKFKVMPSQKDTETYSTVINFDILPNL